MKSRTAVESPLAEALAESIRALDDGRSVHEVMCRGVAALVGANAAAFVRMQSQPERCTVVCWPAEQLVALNYTTREDWPCPSAGIVTTWWRQSLAFGIMRDLLGTLAFAEVALARSPVEERLAVFARQHPFTAEDLWLLSVCSSPLAAIDGHSFHLEERLSGSPVDGAEARPTLSGVGVLLTKREVEVLTLLHLGLKARTMATRLGVSQYTVNKHLGNVYRKLGAHDRLVAVSKAQALGILPSSR